MLDVRSGRPVPVLMRHNDSPMAALTTQTRADPVGA